MLQEHSSFGPSNVEHSEVFSTAVGVLRITQQPTGTPYGRPKITLIDAEPHGKRIPRHSLRVPLFLHTTTCLQGSVRFPTSAYTDEDRYGWYVTLV